MWFLTKNFLVSSQKSIHFLWTVIIIILCHFWLCAYPWKISGSKIEIWFAFYLMLLVLEATKSYFLEMALSHPLKQFYDANLEFFFWNSVIAHESQHTSGRLKCRWRDYQIMYSQDQRKKKESHKRNAMGEGKEMYYWALDISPFHLENSPIVLLLHL